MSNPTLNNTLPLNDGLLVNNEIPLSPIRERTQKAIAQHRAWRKPDLRRTYAGTTGSAIVRRPPTMATSNVQQNQSNTNLISTTILNTVSHGNSKSSIPFDAAAAIYEEIELSEQQRPKTLSPIEGHLLQIESLISTPSNASTVSERSLHRNSTDEEFIDSSYREEQPPHSRLGIEANQSYNDNSVNEIELIRRQQYVYESYRNLQPPPTEQQYTTMSSPHQPIVFRDDESAGTGMSHQELIRKKARSNRRKRLGTGNKLKKPIVQLPVHLLLPARVSTPQKQLYYTIHQSYDTSKPQKRANKLRFMSDIQGDDQEFESSSTTAETTNESADMSPQIGSFAAAIRPPRPSKNRRAPTLAVRGDDAMLWVEPLDQRSLGEDSFPMTQQLSNRGIMRNEDLYNKEALETVTENDRTKPSTIHADPVNIEQVQKSFVRFAKPIGEGDDESSMPWDQKTDLVGIMNSPSTVLENIDEDVHESKNVVSSVVPKSILRKSKYRPSQPETITRSQNNLPFFESVDQTERFNGEQNELPAILQSRDLSPPRMSIAMLDTDGLELSPIPPGRDSENQSIDEMNDNANILYHRGHPAEKHIREKMSTILAIRDGEIADLVREQENYPDPPIEIDVRCIDLIPFLFRHSFYLTLVFNIV
jgi:hypothetical protein